VSETPRDPVPDDELDLPADDEPAAGAAAADRGPDRPGSGPAEGARRARRKRRLIVAGVAVGAALLVLAICAGGLAILSAIGGFTDDTRDDRQQARVRDTACLELEGRLNRVPPPGSAANPPARAAAIRNENAALRPYLADLELRGGPPAQESLTGWRQLLDARGTYAEALDKQASSRTPAFFVAPRDGDGVTVADQLARRSPATCAGSIRRLAAPDL
jgi:hypothetical protein